MFARLSQIVDDAALFAALRPRLLCAARGTVNRSEAYVEEPALV